MKLSQVTAILLLGALTLSGCVDSTSGSDDETPSSNHAPIANAQSLTVEKNSNLSITLSGSDVDGDTLSYTVTTQPTHGQISGTAPNLVYTPTSDYLGSDSFSFRVNDGTVNSSIKTISLQIIEQVAKVTIAGSILYEKVPVKSTGEGLDYTSITQEGAKWVLVEAVDSTGNVVDSTTTDSSGAYQLTAVPAQTDVKLRISAKMLQHGSPSWDVKVVDNTNSGAVYVMEGALSNSGSSDSRRTLLAPSGWSGSDYTSTRVAAPFAILDDIYHSMNMVLGAESTVVFPPLVVNWSTYNKATSGNVNQGEIGTSYYSNSNLFILGDKDSDTDEYDNHVIAHEWGHYYEDKFSRSDSIGGSHGGGDTLDIRVAFGEGFGNAVSAMALQDPLYYDTAGSGQAGGWSMNIESESKNNPGWFSEASIQRILYDLYDSDDESSDTLSMGFAPLHRLFIGAQKQTPAFTSLFSFITELKRANSADADKIDEIVAHENIDTITDIYGNGRSGTPYSNVTVGGSAVNVCLSSDDGNYNKLSNRRYVKFTVSSADSYTIKIAQSNGSDADPDFYLYSKQPLERINGSDTASSTGLESKRITLDAGEYLLDILDYNNLTSACFDVTVKP